MHSLLFRLAVQAEKMNHKEVRDAIKLLKNERSKTFFTEYQYNRNEALKTLIKFVAKENPFYKKRFEDAGIDCEEIKDITDIEKLPILTKDDIKANRQTIVTPSIPNSDCIKRTSGGTTGEPIYIEIEKQARLKDLYAYYRGLAWMGWKPGDSMVKFFGGSLGGNNSPTVKNKIKKIVSRELFIPAFGMNKSNGKGILESIKRRGSTFVQGYVSSIYTLALYAKELNFKGLNIKGVFTTAEQLPQEQAEFIKDVFNCEVKAFYGCAEINSIGFQKEMNGPYLVSGELVHLESTKDANYNLDNTFLITSLHNFKTPLIRYKNGDNGNIDFDNNGYPIITELSGRTADMFVKKDGTYISSILATQTMQITGLTHKIKRYQFIQNELDQIDFLYETFDKHTLSHDDLEMIKKMYIHRMGYEFQIDAHETNSFEKSSNGKHRLMINKL